jgi:hypothetical protein
MIGACVECGRLLREHAEATKAYLKIASHHQIASIQQDSHKLAVLDPIYRKATERLDSTRRALREHRTSDERDKVASEPCA